ncbi:hypothetical protein ABBQ32_005095 [Trebouxia sp. C0010 RCD-2024]
MDALHDILRSFRNEYKKTPIKLQVLDCFLVYTVCTGLVQFAYLLLVGSFPFNSFLAGFFSCLGFFVLTVCLRMQVDPANQDFKKLSPERAFADYVLCNALLHLLIWNYMG